MALLELRGGYLYEHCPHLFPQGFLTSEELALWSAYYARKKENK